MLLPQRDEYARACELNFLKQTIESLREQMREIWIFMMQTPITGKKIF